MFGKSPVVEQYHCLSAGNCRLYDVGIRSGVCNDCRCGNGNAPEVFGVAGDVDCACTVVGTDPFEYSGENFAANGIFGAKFYHYVLVHGRDYSISAISLKQMFLLLPTVCFDVAQCGMCVG